MGLRDGDRLDWQPGSAAPESAGPARWSLPLLHRDRDQGPGVTQTHDDDDHRVCPASAAVTVPGDGHPIIRHGNMTRKVTVLQSVRDSDPSSQR
jgi:hypothetical protein